MLDNWLNNLLLWIIIILGGLLLPVSMLEWGLKNYMMRGNVYVEFWGVFKENYETWKKEVDNRLVKGVNLDVFR